MDDIVSSFKLSNCILDVLFKIQLPIKHQSQVLPSRIVFKYFPTKLNLGLYFVQRLFKWNVVTTVLSVLRMSGYLYKYSDISSRSFVSISSVTSNLLDSESYIISIDKLTEILVGRSHVQRLNRIRARTNACGRPLFRRRKLCRRRLLCHSSKWTKNMRSLNISFNSLYRVRHKNSYNIFVIELVGHRISQAADKSTRTAVVFIFL